MTATPLRPPSTPADFHTLVTTLYVFHPHELTRGEISTKSVALDIFWSQAKADPQHVLPLLREELAHAPDGSLFAYDGATLLIPVE